mmetsp:Transcript_11745/g.30087  ORF Transcript_11745/g.30087 Transcript_11745/m.30087 type:complete len:230 (-) Transcript_11745:1704-2393(-)
MYLAKQPRVHGLGLDGGAAARDGRDGVERVRYDVRPHTVLYHHCRGQPHHLSLGRERRIGRSGALPVAHDVFKRCTSLRLHFRHTLVSAHGVEDVRQQNTGGSCYRGRRVAGGELRDAAASQLLQHGVFLVALHGSPQERKVGSGDDSAKQSLRDRRGAVGGAIRTLCRVDDRLGVAGHASHGLLNKLGKRLVFLCVEDFEKLIGVHLLKALLALVGATQGGHHANLDA